MKHLESRRLQDIKQVCCTWVKVLTSSTLPHGYLDPQVAVNGDGEESQDGALRQDEHRAGAQQAAVEARVDLDADGDGQGDDQRAHGDVSQGQTDDEVEGRVPQRAVQPHRPDHHHVANDGGDGDGHFHDIVESRWAIGHPGEKGQAVMDDLQNFLHFLSSLQKHQVVLQRFW